MPLSPILPSPSTDATNPILVAAVDAPTAIKASAAYVCDGTNDEVQINLALSTQGVNAHVKLSQGTFSIGAPIEISEHSTTLIGSGTGQRNGVTQDGQGTTLLATNTITGAVVQVESGSIVYPVYGVTLRDFTVDCDDQGTAVDGVYFSSNRGLIDHVHVFSATGDGFHFQGVNGWDTYDSTIAFSQASECAGAGLHMDTDSPDCHVISNVIFNNLYGIHIESSSEQITGCHFYNNDDYNIYFDNSGSRTKISNCKIEGSGKHGLYLDSAGGNGTSDVQITGNNFKNSGDSADNTYDHIYIAGLTAAGHTRTVIVGNAFSHQSSASANKPRYGVNMSGAVAQGTLVVGNAFGPSTHWGTAPLFDNSSDSNPALVRNNKGVLDDSYVIYVKDYGAKNDGFTDATAAIQAALDAVPTGGAIVQFDEGEYEIHSPLLVTKDGTFLRGAGFGNRSGATQDGWGTRLSVDGSFSGTELVLFRRVANDRTLFGGGAEGISFDGVSVGAVKGITARLESGVFRNCAFHQFAGDAMTIQGYGSWKAEYNVIDNCLFTNGGDTAITLTTDSKDTLITNNVIETFADKGITVGTSDHLIQGNIIRSCTIIGIVFDNSGNRVRVVNNMISTTGQAGIYLSNTSAGFSDVVISGNTFRDCGGTTTNTYDCITVGSTSTAISRVAITGNTFLGGAANLARYAVNFPGSGSQNCLLVGNTFGPSSHWGTGPVNDNSSATAPAIITANIGFIRDKRVIAKSSSYTAIQLDEVIVVTAGASDKTITLPAAAGLAERAMTIIRADGAAGNVIVDGNASETINGATTKTLGAQYSAITIMPYSGNWIILNQLGTVT